MGAAQFAFPQYLLGSLLGLLPIMLPYIIMGSSASDYTSPAFRIALIAEILVSVLSVVIKELSRNNLCNLACLFRL